jgi:hypothetical protein
MKEGVEKDYPLHGTNGQLMVMAAHRYCLGRKSYIVSSCQDWLKKFWEDFEENTQNVIIRDTLEALIDGDAGDDFHKETWRFFAEWGWKQMSSESRKWCREGLAYKSNSLPIFLVDEPNA